MAEVIAGAVGGVLIFVVVMAIAELVREIAELRARVKMLEERK